MLFVSASLHGSYFDIFNMRYLTREFSKELSSAGKWLVWQATILFPDGCI